MSSDQSNDNTNDNTNTEDLSRPKDIQEKFADEEETPQQITERFAEGNENAHDEQDPKDQRSIGNRLAAASSQNDDTSGKKLTPEDRAAQEDPTLPARMHGNEPSRGAKIDKQIEDEEAALIAKMDAKKEAKKH